MPLPALFDSPSKERDSMQLETMIWNIMSAGLLIATTLITWRDIRPGVAPAGRWVRPVLSRKRLIAILAASTLFAVTGLYLSFQIVLSHSQKIDRTSSFYLHMLLFTVILQYFCSCFGDLNFTRQLTKAPNNQKRT